jgi:hypothetical protein
MRTILAFLLVGLLSGMAMAQDPGTNPQVQMYITSDPAGASGDDYDDIVANFASVEVYIAIACVGADPDGVTSASFLMDSSELTVGGVVGYTNVISDITQGGWETSGVTIAASAPVLCWLGDPIIIATASWFDLGSVGDLKIVDHPDFPRWVTDCGDPTGTDYYCHVHNLGVNKEPEPTGEDCVCGSPVENATWGSIKGLYR